MSICRALDCHEYINPIGGKELYAKAEFQSQGIDLRFIKPKPLEYAQFKNEFIPWLSMIDVLMFNDRPMILEMLEGYELS